MLHLRRSSCVAWLAALLAVFPPPPAPADTVWPPMHSSPESLRAPTNLYDNARPFRWAGQRRTDSLRVAIVLHRWSGESAADRWDSTVVWVMRGDLFGPVNPFLPGRHDPFLVKRLLPGARVVVRCRIPLVEPPAGREATGAPAVGTITLGPAPVRLRTPTAAGGSEIILRTVPGRGRAHGGRRTRPTPAEPASPDSAGASAPSRPTDAGG